MKDLEKTLNQTRRVVFIDFEGSQYSQEIIAIGAIKCTLNSKYQIKKKDKTFKAYVKIDEPIGEFIENLTGITDEFLKENGKPFEEVVRLLKMYVGKEPHKYFVYGNFDQHLLHSSMKLHNMKDDEFLNNLSKNMIDFSRITSKYIKSDKNTPISLVAALKIFQTNIEQDLHDPLNDAINLMHLYNSFLIKKKILKEEYISTLRRSPSLPEPFRKILKKLESDQKVTYKDFLTYIDEEIK